MRSEGIKREEKIVKQNSKPKHNLGSTCAFHFMQISKRTGAVPESSQCKYIEVKGHLEQTFTESKGSKMEIQQQKCKYEGKFISWKVTNNKQVFFNKGITDPG